MKVIDHRTILEKKQTQVHFPFLLEHENGNWYMTYREGPHGGPDGDRVQCVMSTDQGKTWRPWPGLKPEPQLRLFITHLTESNLISHRYQLTDHDEKNGTAIIMYSKDGGATWRKEPARITGLSFNEKGAVGLWGHIVPMPDGRLLCGIEGEKGKEKLLWNPKKAKLVAAVVESTDGGRSWRHIADLCDDQSLGIEGADEMDICLLKSGELISMIRTGASPASHMIQVRSSDGGHTWTKPIDIGFAAVSPQLLLLENGVLVCAYGTRDVHVMADWKGTGEQWSDPMLIYQGQGTGYTDIQALGPDRFRLVFDESSFTEHQSGGNRIVRVEVKVTSKHPAAG